MKSKTYMQKPAEVTRSWHVVDVKGIILGQVASKIAFLLIGKHKPTYTPHVDGGDFVVVINAKEVAVSGTKELNKKYYWYSGFPSGLRHKTLGELLVEKPEQIIELAVYNMLPKNKLRTARVNRLKVYPGSEHKHQSQLAAQPSKSGVKEK